MRERPLVIWGQGGHARVLISACESSGRYVAGQLSGKLDQESEWQQFDFWRKTTPALRLILGFGDRAGRLSVINNPADNFDCLEHAESWLEGSEIGFGTFLAAGSVVILSQLGDHCIVNTCASVDHDCKLADHVIVCPGARLGGGVKIGKAAMIGMGAVVLPRITIGEYATVGAGAVVTKDVPSWAVVVGCPARIIRTVTKLEELPNP